MNFTVRHQIYTFKNNIVKLVLHATPLLLRLQFCSAEKKTAKYCTATTLRETTITFSSVAGAAAAVPTSINLLGP